MRTISLLLISVFFTVGCQHSHKHEHEHSNPSAHHDFADVKKWVKRFDAKSRDKWQRPQYVIDLMQVKPGMSVADIGAGTGYFLPYLDKEVTDGGRVIALDIQPELVEHMKKRISKQQLKNSSAKLCKADDPQLKIKSVDKVLIVDTWHHIQDRINYTKKIIQGLKPGGEIYIVDFQPGVKSPGPKDEHRLSAVTVFKELRSAGLDASVIHEDLEYQYIIRGKKL